ncbi:MAG TPA: alpha/beta hydrolase [Clostridiales bacterium]|jgi:pimeloyl-ACP methyl ester carboxylesterase|nr:alpha/beta hydrolase [Clostridiales bacterium]
MTGTYTQQTIQSGSALISFFEAGEGEALILLHGNGEDYSCFDKQLPDFSRHYRCIAIDSRGHGKSTHGSERLSLRLMAGDVLNVMDALELKKAHILGFSDGGNIALYIALTAPGRVSTLILSGANADPSGIEPKEFKLMLKKRCSLKVQAFFSRAAERKLEVWELMINEPNFTQTELESIALPALITAGEHDVILRGHTEYLSKCLRNSELIIFGGGSHYVHMEQAMLYNETVLNFLRQHIQEDDTSGKEAI